jgi:hypothetical protein
MKKLLLVAGFLVFFLACSKDKYQTKPQIQIKSINNKVVAPGGSLDVIFTYTDKEGDLQGNIFIRKVRVNTRTVSSTLFDTLRFKIPDFPSTSKADIEVNLDYNTILSAEFPPNIPGSNPPQKEPDTLLVKFCVTDKAGHSSDTLTSDKIVVIR